MLLNKRLNLGFDFAYVRKVSMQGLHLRAGFQFPVLVIDEDRLHDELE